MTRQKKEAPREIVSKKATMPKEKVPITKLEEVEQATHWPLKGQKNDHARQTESKKICSEIRFRV